MTSRNSSLVIQSVGDLKLRLVDGEDPRELLEAFLAGLGGSQEFAANGRPAKHELLGWVIDRINRERFGSRKPHKLNTRRIVEDALVHGVVLMEGRIGVIFYFEDILVGLVGFAPGVGDEGFTVIRFSGVDRPTDPSRG